MAEGGAKYCLKKFPPPLKIKADEICKGRGFMIIVDKFEGPLKELNMIDHAEALQDRLQDYGVHLDIHYTVESQHSNQTKKSEESAKTDDKEKMEDLGEKMQKLGAEDRKICQMIDSVVERMNDSKSDLERAESIWLVLTSHGGNDKRGEFLLNPDQSRSYVSDILSELRMACPENKPVVVIIESCRGKAEGKSVEAPAATRPPPSTVPSSQLKGTNLGTDEGVKGYCFPGLQYVSDNEILLWSVTPGNVSKSRWPLLASLESEMQSSGSVLEIECLFTNVMARIAEDAGKFYSQSPVYYSMLRDELQLKKYYDE